MLLRLIFKGEFISGGAGGLGDPAGDFFASQYRSGLRILSRFRSFLPPKGLGVALPGVKIPTPFLCSNLWGGASGVEPQAAVSDGVGEEDRSSWVRPSPGGWAGAGASVLIVAE